jgi:hypothetical protein
VHGVQPPVRRVAPTLHEPALLEAVDQRDQPGGRRPQRLGEGLLPGAAAIARSSPVCGGVRSSSAIRAAKAWAQWVPSCVSRKAAPIGVVTTRTIALDEPSLQRDRYNSSR